MLEKHIAIIAQQMGIATRQVAATITLLDTGATVPFIARYRKEATGSLDEVQIAAVRDSLEHLRNLDKRRDFILQTITEQGKLTPELEKQLMEASTLNELEDYYMPYKPKRRTKATLARERGLEPLATLLLEQNPKTDPSAEAAPFVNPEKEVPTTADALAGARDIIAEQINEHADTRARLRRLFVQKGIISSEIVEGKEKEAEKFKDYFKWNEPIKQVPSHRLLAILRGANEGFLSVTIAPEREDAIAILQRAWLKNNSPSAQEVDKALVDAYKRLMLGSLETEIRNEAKERADQEAIAVFTANLRELLLAPPLGQQNVLAIDPGFRTGCKLVALDGQGSLLNHTVIYPHEKSGIRRYEAVQIVEDWVEKYRAQAIAIGNGTAGRETFDFVRKLDLPENLKVVMVNESGASIYSASEVAREEFPNYDVTVRGAISIGRRLIDPLAELVKIDPKSIGVGQYQHDVNQTELQKSLDDIVMSCVNAVGVEVNTASKQLLTYVSGIGTRLAQKIVEHRQQNGTFDSRSGLLKVAGLGPKAYEQAAGFLRISHAANPLDASAVHPESYSIVETMAKHLGCTTRELITNAEKRQQIHLPDYVTSTVGIPTLTDIVKELEKPGRDPRQHFEQVAFDETVSSIDDLRVDMILPGIITNVTNFGAFVDIGVHESGLVHISQISDKRIADPKQVLRVNQRVMVRVSQLDLERKRIQLSMRGVEQPK